MGAAVFVTILEIKKIIWTILLKDDALVCHMSFFRVTVAALKNDKLGFGC